MNQSFKMAVVFFVLSSANIFAQGYINFQYIQIARDANTKTYSDTNPVGMRAFRISQ